MQIFTNVKIRGMHIFIIYVPNYSNETVNNNIPNWLKNCLENQYLPIFCLRYVVTTNLLPIVYLFNMQKFPMV